jgi:hypothetical protein
MIEPYLAQQPSDINFSHHVHIYSTAQYENEAVVFEASASAVLHEKEANRGA